MESTTRVKVAKFMEFIEFHNIQFEKGAEKVSRKEFVWPRMGKYQCVILLSGARKGDNGDVCHLNLDVHVRFLKGDV